MSSLALTPQTAPSLPTETFFNLPETWFHPLPVHWKTSSLELTPQTRAALPTEICFSFPAICVHALPVHRKTSSLELTPHTVPSIPTDTHFSLPATCVHGLPLTLMIPTATLPVSWRLVGVPVDSCTAAGARSPSNACPSGVPWWSGGVKPGVSHRSAFSADSARRAKRAAACRCCSDCHDEASILSCSSSDAGGRVEAFVRLSGSISSGRAATNTRLEKTWSGRPPAFSTSVAAARKSSVYRSTCRFMAS